MTDIRSIISAPTDRWEPCASGVLRSTAYEGAYVSAPTPGMRPNAILSYVDIRGRVQTRVRSCATARAARREAIAMAITCIDAQVVR